MTPLQQARIIKTAIRMFRCDTARISSFPDRSFLIIGHKMDTRNDRTGQWYRNGEPYDFEYVDETVIASGKTAKELLASMKEYKRLSGMTMTDYIKEWTSANH